MAFPIAHKAVVVLDHSPQLRTTCKETVDLDVFTKSRAPGFIPLAPITKAMWTCNVEAIMEYSRIIFDIFPTDRLLSLIASDNEARVVTTWNHSEQSLHNLMMSMAKIGPPPEGVDQQDCPILHGIDKAIEILCQPSAQQTACLNSGTEASEQLVNRGRIVCLTMLKSESFWTSLEQSIHEKLLEHNRLAAANDNLMVIGQLDLCMIHLTPVGVESKVAHRKKREVSPLLTSELHVSQSGHFIAARMVELVMDHYILASTTVTGIPMKEEQNASSSANYDVELLHPAGAHADLCGADGLALQPKDGAGSTAVTLKWCTPKSNTVELQQCMGAYRITPVDVNSRPSSCLTNFLLNGRAVMLEQPRKTGPRMLSHMLASHGGEIYLHMLATARSLLEDPPSISEGGGGRVTDYRIKDFGFLMKEHRMVPVAPVETDETLPMIRCKQQMERATRFWPMVISDSIIFNMLPELDPLPTLIVKTHLDKDDVVKCQTVIYHVVDMERKNESLAVPTTGTRGKGPKREEQYRQIWSELQQLCRAHADTSPAHRSVLDCLLRCKRPESGSLNKRPSPETIKEDEATTAWKELEKFQHLTEREKQDANMETKPTASPPPKRIRPSMEFGKSGQSLLSMWTSRLNAMQNQRRVEFAGRSEAPSNKADLYQSLRDENGELPEGRGVSQNAQNG